MFTKFKTILASAVISLGALAAAPATAQADSLYFAMGTGGHVTVGAHSGGYEPVRHRDWHRHPRPHGCTNYQAVRKATRMGMRRAGIVRANPRRVIVEGRSRYGWHRVTFSRAPGCPVVR